MCKHEECTRLWNAARKAVLPSVGDEVEKKVVADDGSAT